MTPITTALVVAAIVALLATASRPVPRRGHGPTESIGDRHHLNAAWQPARFRQVGRRHQAPTADAVAAWCDDLARRIRAGVTLRDALTTTIPNDPATRLATERTRLALERGRPITAALGLALDGPATPGPHLTFVVRVLSTTALHGGPAAAAIDGAGTVLRQRVADGEERQVHAAQARLSAHVLTAIPVALLGLLLSVDPDVRSAVASPVGAVCLTVGSALNGIGWWWMRQVVRVRW